MCTDFVQKFLKLQNLIMKIMIQNLTMGGQFKDFKAYIPFLYSWHQTQYGQARKMDALNADNCDKSMGMSEFSSQKVNYM